MRLVSRRTMSWSLCPIEGSSLHISINEGWDVKMRSRVLSLRVGKVTTSICSKLLSAVMSRKHWLKRIGYWPPSICRVAQLMSGRLKSQPRRIYQPRIYLSLFSHEGYLISSLGEVCFISPIRWPVVCSYCDAVLVVYLDRTTNQFLLFYSCLQ